MAGTKHLPSLVLCVAACALVATTLVVAAPFPPTVVQQASSAAPVDDAAVGLFTQMCVKCHDAARITAMRRTTTEWEEVLNKMIEKGATGTEKDFDSVYQYLRRAFGKVNINFAPADDLTTILGLSEKEAGALVAYRKANGNFADLDAVKKVPGIDLKKLDDHKDAIAF